MPQSQFHENKVFVIGHKNPDTDSICSAISYAWLKNEPAMRDPADSSCPQYIPMRAGHVNQETAFVLDYFQVPAPDYITDVEPQVKDIAIKEVEGIAETVSLREAYISMRTQESVTLPVIGEDKQLKGVITINDIAESDMDVYDNQVVGNARTPVRNILKTLDGQLLSGNPHAQITKGHVVIAAAKGDLMSDFIRRDDIVITANRERAQRCAIEKGASLLLITGSQPTQPEIIDKAKEKEVIVIQTPHDTYTAARLLNQSMPVQRYMCAENLVTFRLEDTAESVQESMAKHRFRDFPILDRNGNYVGMISRRNLLGLRRKQLILVDHNELSQAVDGAAKADILEIIDHHRLDAPETSAPVYFRCQPLGCTATIIREICRENAVEIPPVIAGLLCSAILSDTLLFRSPTCTRLDEITARELGQIAGIPDLEQYAKDMFNAGSDLMGKSAEDIFFQDFKKFNAGEASFGAGQITTMNEGDFPALIEKLRPFMEKEVSELHLDALYFLLTGILSESSVLISCGKNAVKTAEEAFGIDADENGILMLPGVVSRKKQFIPPMIARLQQQ
ncbi:MAG: putative manganese-dependent inorganic diphosphatase [Eubacteriales bacterium]|nr:putative manganese-dependent inorganic diphosphatase [Eubacteriales bacterium]